MCCLCSKAQIQDHSYFFSYFTIFKDHSRQDWRVEEQDSRQHAAFYSLFLKLTNKGEQRLAINIYWFGSHVFPFWNHTVLDEINLGWTQMLPLPWVFKLRGSLGDLSWSWLYRVSKLYSSIKLHESTCILSNLGDIFS